MGQITCRYGGHEFCSFRRQGAFSPSRHSDEFDGKHRLAR